VHTILLVTVVVHVLAGVFWAGSTFALARTDGVGARALAGPQMGAAGAAIVAGLVLWGLTHRYGFDRQARVLAVGAACAILAAAVHGGAHPACCQPVLPGQRVPSGGPGANHGDRRADRRGVAGCSGRLHGDRPVCVRHPFSNERFIRMFDE